MVNIKLGNELWNDLFSLSHACSKLFNLLFIFFLALFINIDNRNSGLRNLPDS